MPGKYYEPYYRKDKEHTSVDINLERHEKYNLLRTAGFNIEVSRRLRDWQWKGVYSALDIKSSIGSE